MRVLLGDAGLSHRHRKCGRADRNRGKVAVRSAENSSAHPQLSSFPCAVVKPRRALSPGPTCWRLFAPPSRNWVNSYLPRRERRHALTIDGHWQHDPLAVSAIVPCAMLAWLVASARAGADAPTAAGDLGSVGWLGDVAMRLEDEAMSDVNMLPETPARA